MLILKRKKKVLKDDFECPFVSVDDVNFFTLWFSNTTYRIRGKWIGLKKIVRVNQIENPNNIFNATT